MRWPLIRVTWVDSSSPSGWERLKAVLEPYDMTHESVGWLLKETDDRITIAAHFQVNGVDENPCVDGVMTIPIVAITKRSVLEEAK